MKNVDRAAEQTNRCFKTFFTMMIGYQDKKELSPMRMQRKSTRAALAVLALSPFFGLRTTAKSCEPPSSSSSAAFETRSSWAYRSGVRVQLNTGPFAVFLDGNVSASTEGEARQIIYNATIAHARKFSDQVLYQTYAVELIPNG